MPKRFFCEHCKDYVAKSTYYAHRGLSKKAAVQDAFSTSESDFDGELEQCAGDHESIVDPQPSNDSSQTVESDGK